MSKPKNLYELLTQQPSVTKGDVATLHTETDGSRIQEILDALASEGYENLPDD